MLSPCTTCRLVVYLYSFDKYIYSWHVVLKKRHKKMKPWDDVYLFFFAKYFSLLRYARHIHFPII